MKNIDKKSTVAIYGCGGGGINMMRGLHLPNEAAGFPVTTFTAIDTSRSNIDEKVVSMGGTYFIAGVDGAGKDRRFAHAQVAPHVNQALQKNPPKDLNIVIFGASGGSGSVIGPLLIEEMINRGLSVIGVTFISTASKKEADNAYNTLGTLQNFSLTKLGKPIILNIHENSSDTTRAAVDQAIDVNVRALAMLGSGTNLELDRKDIHNWLNYPLVTSTPAQLTELVIELGGCEYLKQHVNRAISVAHLLPGKDVPEVNLSQQYGCVGYCSESTTGATTHTIPAMYFAITNTLLNARLAKLKSIIDEYEAAEKEIHSVTAQTFDTREESGFVF